MMLRHTLLFCVLFVAVLGGSVAASAQENEREAFAFLAGTWELEERIDHDRRTRERGSDRYEFEQPIAGGALAGRWRFNRGSEAKPDWARALYVSGYHDASRSWSFYYVSERSAQYWLGRKSGGTWYFYFDEAFEYQGKKTIQRQWWERVSPDQVKRHFEHSYDNGKTWQLVLTAVLRRVR